MQSYWQPNLVLSNNNVSSQTSRDKSASICDLPAYNTDSPQLRVKSVWWIREYMGNPWQYFHLAARTGTDRTTWIFWVLFWVSLQLAAHYQDILSLFSLFLLPSSLKWQNSVLPTLFWKSEAGLFVCLDFFQSYWRSSAILWEWSTTWLTFLLTVAPWCNFIDFHDVWPVPSEANLNHFVFALATAKWPMRTFISETLCLRQPQQVLSLAQQRFVWVEKSYNYDSLRYLC